MFFFTTFTAICFICLFCLYKLFISPRFNPLARLSGPPVRSLFSNHLKPVLDPSVSRQVHEIYVKHYGRSIRLRGMGPWDDRLLTLDPYSITHVLKNSHIYEKPWLSRRLITSLIGCGMLSAEGSIHKRQRRVATPAFSIQNMRALIPLMFRKGTQLANRLHAFASVGNGTQVDINNWMVRATFDVIGLAGLDYDFNAIEDETNELLVAYREMFETVISQGALFRTLMIIWCPIVNKLFPDDITRTLDRCQDVIYRRIGEMIQDKKRKLVEGEANGKAYEAKDVLTLLLKSNISLDIPEDARISDKEIMDNVNTIIFAGSDSSALTLTWALLTLAQHPESQSRLREELLSVISPSALQHLTDEELGSCYDCIAELPFFHNVLHEILRLIPPMHSSIRVATKDDILPTQFPIRLRNGKVEEPATGVFVPKGSFVHIAVEGFNLDREIWGPDAWEFNPDRWDNLPELAKQQPGLLSNILTFSAGPRSCIGMRLSLIELKVFLYFLVTNFVFSETDEKIAKMNVVLTRPYISGKFREGSQCPLFVAPYKSSS